MAKVEAIIADDKTVKGKRFNHDQQQIVCPWHGWEFDAITGCALAAPAKARVRTYAARVQGDRVLVDLE